MIPKRLVITPGEPAGVGPDITLRAAQVAWPVELIAIADPTLLQNRAKQLRSPPLQLIEYDGHAIPQPHRPGQLKIIPITTVADVVSGELNPANAKYVMQTLETAANFCLNNPGSALVTGPVHKGIMNEAGIKFKGHTEFFAHHCQVPQTIMLFVVTAFKVALMTTHLPLTEVPAAISKEHLQSMIKLLNAELQRQFHIATPRILVCGLNPHAGENGYLGREEIEIISPAITELRTQNINVTGPFSADTIFTEKYLQKADVIVAMYHDQALPLVKYIGFANAVNVTLGLPFVRTSVDHGTALDIAGTTAVDAGSMLAAIDLAIKINV